MFLFAQFSFADKMHSLVQLEYRGGKTPHHYTLKKSEKPEAFQLVLKEGGKKTQVKNIKPHQANFILNESIELLWLSKYKNKKPSQKCTTHLKIQYNKESTALCYENAETTGLSIGLLNSMKTLF